MLVYGVGAHLQDMLNWHPDLAGHIERIFDKDPQKTGTVLPGVGKTIESPEALCGLPMGTRIAISAIRYYRAIAQEIRAINPGLICLSIDDAYQLPNVNINLTNVGIQRLRFAFNADVAFYEKLCALLRLYEVSGIDLVRVGRENDGGYLMLDDFRGEDDGRRIAYSFGISDDVSWDLAMAERGYDVYMYDHTIEACPGSHERFRYHKLGIGAQSEPENLLCTLEELLTANGHEQVEHMILKMDVEGAEWQVLDLLPDSVLQRFDQIALELHWLVTSTEEAKAQEMLRVLSKLGRMHALVHLHGNNNASHLELGGQAIPDVIEVTYVNRSCYQAHALRSASLPSSLDMPNCVALPEIILGSWTGNLQGMEERKGGISMQLSGTEWGGVPLG